MESFNYQTFTNRNIGFVTEKEQQQLKNAHVFVPGVGGMGGAAVACLARMGVENFTIADMDTFEISNMNRQIFSNLEVMGQEKTAVTKAALQNINPNITIKIYQEEWVEALDTILPTVQIVINGCDDIKATITLLRKCAEHGVACIDAFASTLPNVYVIRPDAPRPEVVLNFPTQGLPLTAITKDMEKECLMKEIAHVATHSSSLDYIDPEIAQAIMNGTRKRSSFAPMVWMTGCLMAHEAMRWILQQKSEVGVKGVFFNFHTYQVEKAV